RRHARKPQVALVARPPRPRAPRPQLRLAARAPSKRWTAPNAPRPAWASGRAPLASCRRLQAADRVVAGPRPGCNALAANSDLARSRGDRRPRPRPACFVPGEPLPRRNAPTAIADALARPLR